MKENKLHIQNIEQALIVLMHINIEKGHLLDLNISIEELYIQYVLHASIPSPVFLDHCQFFTEILESMKQNDINNIPESMYQQLISSHFPEELTNQLLLEYSDTQIINTTISFLNKIISHEH